jgi:hypothetical protein
MKTFWRCNIGAAGVMTLLLSFGIAADSTQAAGEYERPPVLNANMVLPKSVLKSEHFTIDQKVLNDGLVNSYKVSSPLVQVAWGNRGHGRHGEN